MEIRYIEQTDDRAAISRIYEKSWKFAYKDIIPQGYLDSIPTGQWVSSLDKSGRKSLVMIENNTFIGTSSFCRSRFPDFDGSGEIVSIYFLPEYMGKGYGKLLMDAVIAELSKMEFNDVFLWVLEDNYRARKFYEKYGFVQSDNSLYDNIGGKNLREIQYRYYIR